MNKRPLPKGIKLFSEQATKIFSGVRFDTYQWQQKQFDDTTKTFELVKRNDTIVVIPVIDDEVILIDELQPHYDEPKLSLIGGVVEADEDIAVAARRELEEESGMIFKNFTLVHINQIGAPQIEWFAYTFIATGYLYSKEKHLDSGEKNEVIRVKIQELVGLTKTHGLYYPCRIIEQYLIEGKEKELLEVFKHPEKFAIPL